MSNLHKDQNEANKHTAKGFVSGANGSACIRNENGAQEFEKPYGFPAAINFVDGNAAPPTTAFGDIYVLIDLGNGALHPDWATIPTVEYGDWVKNNPIWLPRKAIEGTQCFNNANQKNYYFDGADWVAASVTVETRLGNILYVSTNGSNVESRVNALGNLNITLTPERAVAVAVAGDVIHVMAGTYILTLATANGYWVNGVNWHLEKGVTIKKSTAGNVFKMQGATYDFVVTGNAYFDCNTLCENLVQANTSGYGFTFDCEEVLHSSLACFNLSTAGIPNVAINIKKKINVTGGAIVVNSANNFSFTCPEILNPVAVTSIGSLGGYANIITNNFTNTTGSNCVVSTNNNFNMSGAFVSKADLRGGICNVARMTTLKAGQYTLNTSFVMTGFVTGRYTHEGGEARIHLAQEFYGDYLGVVYICMAAATATSTINMSGNGLIANVSLERAGSFTTNANILNITLDNNTTLNTVSDWKQAEGTFTIGNGTGLSTFRIDSEVATGLSAAYFSFKFILNPTGKIEILKKLINKTVYYGYSLIEHNGGILEINGGSIIVPDQDFNPIKCLAPQNIKIMQGFTNKSNLLLGSKKKQQQRVSSAADASITLNGILFTADVATYPTVAALATQLVALINGNGLVNVLATYISAGDFYTQSTVYGVAGYTVSYTLNTALVQLINNGSEALTDTVGGVLLPSPNIS